MNGGISWKSEKEKRAKMLKGNAGQVISGMPLAPLHLEPGRHS
jgi:hypothetical protein